MDKNMKKLDAIIMALILIAGLALAAFSVASDHPVFYDCRDGKTAC